MTQILKIHSEDGKLQCVISREEIKWYKSLSDDSLDTRNY